MSSGADSRRSEGRVTAEGPEGHGLIVDYGGVLTSSVARSFRSMEREEGLPKGTLLNLLVSDYLEEDPGHPVARLERGELSVEEFDRIVAEQLREEGHELEAEAVTDLLFADVEPAEEMWRVVARARAAGVRTALLSNSWGLDGYPTDRIEEHFDAVVLSGDVGMRKPDPRMYELAAQRLGLPAARCAFVDDLEANVEGARQVGMFVVLHEDVDETVDQLTGFLGVDLRGGS